MALTKKQRLFVDEYLIDLNATQAAIRAGYSTRRATEIGYQLLQRPEVAQAIQAAMAERSKRTEVEADYVIRRLREIDEMDVLDILEDDGSFRSIRDWPKAWRKIIARMRYKVDGLRNRVDVTTTPEGFKFVFQQFVKQLREKPHLQDLYGLVQASTYDNEANLPDDYIDSLMESYPPQLIAAYLRGQFVNLTSGTIYTAYDRTLNASQETVQPGETLFVGMDFNVGKMAAVVHVKRLGLPHAVDEIVNGYDTPDMIRQIKERFWLYADGDYRPTRQIRIYPDASGDSRKSVRASETDIALLKQAGFIVSAPAANPPVKDRINSMNAMFCNAKGERRYRVNPDRCPTYADALEQQVWGTNGEPDKSADIDHPNDAAGYFIHKEFPVERPAAVVTTLRF